MINIFNYLQDEACWQAKAVLAYLQGNLYRLTDDKYHNYHIDVEVGRYENCREQGYVFSLKFWGRNSETNKFGHYQRNYAVYEHRNSDTICVLISNTFTINTPGIDEMWKDKGENPKSRDYDAGFEYDEITKCGEYIIQDMDEFIAKYGEETNPEDK